MGHIELWLKKRDNCLIYSKQSGMGYACTEWEDKYQSGTSLFSRLEYIVLLIYLLFFPAIVSFLFYLLFPFFNSHFFLPLGQQSIAYSILFY